MKTPEEMAEEHANIRCPEQGSEFIVWCMCRDDFLAGYKAGHHAGFESCLKIQEAVTEHLEKQMIEEMYLRMEPLLKEDK